MAGTVYLVSTQSAISKTSPARCVLGEVGLIACEDTRHTQKLLNHYGIKTKTISYHEHNERERAADCLTGCVQA
jgi:16S rRNA (cytidine1402-2'-O)-methyltransferase